MNKSSVIAPPANEKTPSIPMVGFTIHTQMSTYLAVKEAAHRDRLSVGKWVTAAINAKLGKTTEQ